MVGLRSGNRSTNDAHTIVIYLPGRGETDASRVSRRWMLAAGAFRPCTAHSRLCSGRSVAANIRQARRDATQRDETRRRSTRLLRRGPPVRTPGGFSRTTVRCAQARTYTGDGRGGAYTASCSAHGKTARLCIIHSRRPVVRRGCWFLEAGFAHLHLPGSLRFAVPSATTMTPAPAIINSAASPARPHRCRIE